MVAAMDPKISKNIVIGAFMGAGLVAALTLASRKSSRYSLMGKVTLITGGSRGLGLVLARQMADQGCRIAICARDPRELQRAKNDLSDRGVDVQTFVCDVT